MSSRFFLNFDSSIRSISTTNVERFLFVFFWRSPVCIGGHDCTFFYLVFVATCTEFFELHRSRQREQTAVVVFLFAVTGFLRTPLPGFASLDLVSRRSFLFIGER